MLPGRNPAGTVGGAHKGLCGFSSTGDHFALTSGTGIVKIFNTVSGSVTHQLGAEEAGDGKSGTGHLTANYRSLAWVSASNPKTPSKSKKKNALGGGAMVVLGGGGGEVSAFSATAGDLMWRTPGCHAGEVSGVAFCAATGTLFSAGADAQVCELNATSGEVSAKWNVGKHPITALAVSPDGSRVVVGSASLGLWDVASRERLAKFSGHSVSVSGVAFSPSGSHCVSHAPGENHMAVFECQPATQGAKIRKGAVGVLSMEHPCVHLSTAPATSANKDDSFHALAMSEVGEAYVWLCGTEGGGGLAKSSWRIRVDGVEHLWSQMWRGGEELMVVRGSMAKPTFQTINLPPPTGKKAAAVVCLEANEESGVLMSNNDARAKSSALSVSQSSVTASGEAERLRPAMMMNGGERRKRKGLEEDEDDDDEEGAGEPAGVKTTGSDVDMTDGDQDGLGEESLGERLASLGVEGEDALDPRGRHRGGGAGGSEGLPKADSLGVLLAQAVKAEDRVLLERCLAVADDALVTNTVAGLQAPEALLLLEQLLLRLQARPGRGIQLARWIRAVTVSHAAYLMSAPGAVPHMTTLYQILEARLVMMKPLLSLNGRLDLLLAQQQQANSRSAQAAPSGSSRGPLVDFVEPESQNQLTEIEDPFAIRSGNEEEDEDEWETDEEKSDDNENSDEDEEDDFDED